MEKKTGTNNILVIEDEPTIRRVCRRILSDEGYRVDVASNGEQALKMISIEEYALLLVDIRTPLMDGQELYIHLLQENPHIAKRVIFTTGDVMGSQVHHFIKLCKRPFLPKPFNSNDLRKTVRKAMKKNS